MRHGIQFDSSHYEPVSLSAILENLSQHFQLENKNSIFTAGLKNGFGIMTNRQHPLATVYACNHAFEVERGKIFYNEQVLSLGQDSVIITFHRGAQDFSKTNIYTMFRGLIIDFGI